MKISTFVPKYTLVAALVVYLFLAFTISARAEGVSLRPSLLDISANPGAQVEFYVEFENKEDAALVVSTIKLQKATDEFGESFLQENPDIPPFTWTESLLDSPLVAEPQETVEVPFVLNIPESATPGGYYMLLGIDSSVLNAEEKVGANKRLTSTIYLNVLGESNQPSVDISNFDVRNKISFKPDVRFNVKLLNDGTSHLQPISSLVVVDSTGVLQENSLMFNDNLEYLLPDESFEQEIQWVDQTIRNRFLPPIGKYQANLQIYTVSDSERVIEQETINFYVFPLQYLAYAALAIIPTGIIAIKFRKKK